MDDKEKAKVTKEEWKEICQRLEHWCSYDEVKDATKEQAEEYIRTMDVFVPM